MKLIEAKTLGSNANTVIFTDIPQTYTDLVLLISARTNGAFTSDTLYVTMNSSTSNFSWENIYSTGNNPVVGQSNSDNQLASGINGNNSTALVFSNVEIYIPNYRNTAHNKSITNQGAVENNATRGDNYIDSVLWNNTSSITSMTLSAVSGSAFVTNSTFYLYGISNTIANGAKATGGIVYEDTNYFYHTFLSSGTFTPTQSITADVLVIAGGGGGGGPEASEDTGGGGGGGAGALLAHTSQSLTATGYAITVGAGGTAGTGSSAGTNGANSQFGSISVSTGGGYGGGGGNPGYNGANGGSGGGGRSQSGAKGGSSAGTGTTGGNDGGTGYSGGQRGGGGGGGAGAVGTAGGFSSSGAGGVGVNTYSSWATATLTGVGGYYAGGGGAGEGGASGNGPGAGGVGGAGNGGYNQSPGVPAIINTGSGGGGGGQKSSFGGNGASGLVIVRYAK